MSHRDSNKTITIRSSKPIENIVEEAFRLYYNSSPCIEEPPQIAMREFAFQFFGSESYVRHLSFESYSELLEFIARKAPKQAYYSVALYELPEAGSMEEKNWLGSDLLFDLDLDHTSLCGDTVVEGVRGGVALADQCLLEGYRLAKKLASMIRRDLRPDRTLIYFTGNRGFHIRVKCERCSQLSRAERREIARYFAGEGVNPLYIFPPPRRGKKGRVKVWPAMPEPTDPGWRGWISPVLRAAAPGARSLEKLGRNWSRSVEEAVRQASVPIDILVTQDPSRLTRILGSLNGKGGLMAVDVTDEFRPYAKYLSPFRGEVTVRFLTEVSGLRFLGNGISARRGEEAVLPAAVGLYLGMKGVVSLVGGEISVRKGSCWRPV